MPDWFPHNLAEVVVFTPLRIIFLIIVAVLARADREPLDQSGRTARDRRTSEVPVPCLRKPDGGHQHPGGSAGATDLGAGLAGLQRRDVRRLRDGIG